MDGAEEEAEDGAAAATDVVGPALALVTLAVATSADNIAFCAVSLSAADSD